MLPIQSTNKILSRIVKTADGRTALIHFLVTFEGEKFGVKIISVEYQNSAESNHVAICGPCEKSIQNSTPIPVCNESILGALQELQFFVNQPTRAPSFV